MTEKASEKKSQKSKASKGHEGEQEAYLVLARKYRPADFSDLIGQDAMVQTLRNAFASGRIAQSYMLSGVRGVGKTTTARILARALNYETDKVNEPTIDMKTQGTHCPAIMAGTHVDVMEMDAASHTGIDDIREIIEAARYKPVSARYKVYIIDEVHMLSKSAFNGLLKTLEEPPAHVKFIFATTELRKVPVTVLSRCQRFDLRRIDIDALTDHFSTIAKKEKVKIKDDAISLIARAAEGSVRDGLSLLDQAFARAGKKDITATDIRSMLGLADRAEILGLLKAIFKGDAQTALTSFRTFYENGGDPQQIIADMAEAVHSVTRSKALSSLQGNDDQPEAAQQEIEEMAGALSHAVLHRAWQTLLQGYDEIGNAPNQLSAAEMVLLRLTYMSDLPSPGDLITALKNAQDAPVNAPAQNNAGASPEQPKATHTQTKGPRGRVINGPDHHGEPDIFQDPQTAPQAQAQAAPLLQSFQDVVALIGEHRDVKLKLQVEEYAELVNFAPGRIELHMLEGADDGFVGDLSSKLTRWTGQRWMVALSHERGQQTIAHMRRAQEQKELEQIKSHPTVEAAMKAFPGAQITDIKPLDDDESKE